jgi:murein DD-endopeptidase MepM/ murein hydrolase activator NlpD
MKKTLLLLILITAGLFASPTKKELKKTKYYIHVMNKKLNVLARQIAIKQQDLNDLNKKISSLNRQIYLLETNLSKSNQKLSSLQALKKGYEAKYQNIQNEINDFLSKNYYLDTQEIDNLNDLIYNVMTQKILKQYSKQIANLVKTQNGIKQNIKILTKEINEILQKQKLLKNEQNRLKNLIALRKKQITELQKQKEIYKRKLYSMIKKAKSLQQKLTQLAVVKKRKQSQKTSMRYLKPQPYPVSYYKGIKTVAPLKGTVIKRFGTYVDPVYKIVIHNYSITIHAYRPNAVVRSIMPGKVIYIGTHDDKKIIIIKHPHDFFSIYANLSMVSPILRKGSFVKRGQIIARVKHNLEFEITYREKPINPLRVIKLR